MDTHHANVLAGLKLVMIYPKSDARVDAGSSRTRMDYFEGACVGFGPPFLPQ